MDINLYQSELDLIAFSGGQAVRIVGQAVRPWPLLPTVGECPEVSIAMFWSVYELAWLLRTNREV